LAKPVDIGHRVFPTQTAATKHFREILNSCELGDTIEGDKARDLSAVLALHPDFEQKVGVGVRRYYVAKAPDHPTRCFWLERMDGSNTDFSLKSAITGSNTSTIQAVARAFREYLAPTLILAKRNHFDIHGRGTSTEKVVQCEVTNELISYEQAHLDHKPPSTFEVLVRNFLAARKLKPTEELIIRGGDAQSATRLADSSLGDDFVEYHRKVADLRIIKSSANLAASSTHRIRRPKNPVVL